MAEERSTDRSSQITNVVIYGLQVIGKGQMSLKEKHLDVLGLVGVEKRDVLAVLPKGFGKLKVNRKEGKVDIVLNEESLFKADEKYGVKRGKPSQGIKTSEGRQQGRTSRNHLATKNQSKSKDKKVVSTFKSHKRGLDERDASKRVESTSNKTSGPESVSHLTKGQLHTVASSSPIVRRAQDNQHQLFQESSQTKQLGPASDSLRGVSKQSNYSTEAHRASPDTNSDPTANAGHEQIGLVDFKNSQWKKELDEQVAVKQKLKLKENVRSKGEMFEEYNPWGRPGGGAPVRSQSGNVVADYRRMVLDLSSKSGASVTVTTPHTVTPTASQSAQTTHPTVPVTPTVSQSAPAVPVAMKSSFAIGAPGIVSCETQQEKVEEKRNWLHKLEKQIIEKKERENQQKSQQESKQHTWARNQEPTQPSTKPSPVRAVSQDDASTALDSSFRVGDSHARGFGMHSLHQMNHDELERRRLKTLEHQLAIQEQVEERRRIKQQEKERRLQEEAEEERKLAQERASLQSQFKNELKTRQEKEEEARLRAETLRLSVLQAYESAQQAKMEKRIKHLEYGGHDVSGLKSRAEAGSRLHDTSQLAQPSTDTSPHTSPRRGKLDTSRTEISRSSPGMKEERKSPESDGKITALSYTSPLKLDLEENSLNASLRSEWRDSPAAPTARSMGRVRSLPHASSSPRKATESVSRATRSHSEKGEQKKQPVKQGTRKRASLENMSRQGPSDISEPGRSETSPVPRRAMEDAFMVPYRRSSSTTFAVVPDTPASQQQPAPRVPQKVTAAAKDNRSTTNAARESPVMLPVFRTTSSHFLEKTNGTTLTRPVKESTRKTVPLRRDKVTQKHGQKQTNREAVIKQDSRNIAGKKVPKKENIHIIKAGKLQPLHAQVSPDPLPTTRQELILQQLAALRQGLMLKERELQHSAL